MRFIGPHFSVIFRPIRIIYLHLSPAACIHAVHCKILPMIRFSWMTSFEFLMTEALKWIMAKTIARLDVMFSFTMPSHSIKS